jgi:hypothetical protein
MKTVSMTHHQTSAFADWDVSWLHDDDGLMLLFSQ